MTSYNAPGNIQYNYAQLEGIWCQAGGAPGAAPIAGAIAMAESGGNTTATDMDSNGSIDRGLWQINSVHGTQSTYDVMGNARAAIAISNNGNNWTPWTTFNNGAYQQFLQANVPADTSAPINATNAAANATDLSYSGGGLNPLNYLDPFGFFGKIFDLPQTEANQAAKTFATILQGAIITLLQPLMNVAAGVAGITAGGVMVLTGIFLMVRSTDAGQAVERGAGTAAQAGMMAVAPEAAATTQYVGRSGQITNVTQHRRPAGAVRIGGQRIQYRPARVRTEVNRPAPEPTTQQNLRDQAGEYTRRRQPQQ
jgi:hypothetical protein